MTLKRVTTDEDTLDHVVYYNIFFDGSGKSLCGKSVWPGNWNEDDNKMLCAGCAQAIKEKRVQRR